MKRFAQRIIAALMTSVLCCAPLSASAAPVFGGKVNPAIPCFNAAIWTTVSAPRGGIYIWTPATRTYSYGRPAGGKYILGLYGVPYFCIVFIFPLIVFPGISMTMIGTSH